VDSLANDNAKMDEALQSMVSDPNVAVVSLKGTEKAPKSTANTVLLAIFFLSFCAFTLSQFLF